jgi:hypothetical protein
LKNLKRRDWFEGSRHRWKNTKKDLEEIRWDNADSIHVAKERNQWTLMKFQVPLKVATFLST